MALHEYHAQAIRAVIQSRIDLGEYDTAARLCLRAGAAGIVDDQLPTYELVLKPSVVPSRNYGVPQPLRLSPLHAAADRRFFHVIELLLVVYHVDPVIRNGNGGKRPIDVIGELSPDEKGDEDFKRIYFLLDQCTKAQEFQQLTTAILGSQDVMTRESIVALTPNMTAVQDLQAILSLGVASLEIGEFKQVIREAFQHVIDFKLVFNNDAAVYFKIGLEQCFAEGYLTKPELEHWILEMSKVNMEGAQWVAEIKQKIQSMQAQVVSIEDNGHLLKTHFESLRQALIKKETQEKRKADIKMKLTMFTLGLTAVCGPVVKDLIKCMLHLADPALHLSASLSATSEEKVAKWCSTSGTKLALNAGVDKALTHCGIDPEKFTDVLKQAVIFEHPEFAQVKSKPVETATYHLQPPSILPGNRGREDEGENLTLTLQDYENQRLDDFPYHFAIQQSHGDFEEFLHLLDAADEDDHDANQAHDVIVSAVNASTSSKFNFTRLTLPPHVFASYLGYADIVNYFRGRKDFRVSMGGERMVVTVNRARKVGNVARMA